MISIDDPLGGNTKKYNSSRYSVLLSQQFHFPLYIFKLFLKLS